MNRLFYLGILLAIAYLIVNLSQRKPSRQLLLSFIYLNSLCKEWCKNRNLQLSFSLQLQLTQINDCSFISWYLTNIIVIYSYSVKFWGLLKPIFSSIIKLLDITPLAGSTITVIVYCQNNHSINHGDCLLMYSDNRFMKEKLHEIDNWIFF